MEHFLIVTIKDWNIKNFSLLKEKFKNKCILHLISEKEKLNVEVLKQINPRYIFFPHWSWKISKDIYENFNCVIFHETDLPYGRGGSPIQNLIQNKIYKTKITALKVSEEIDAGDIYLKCDFDLDDGRAQEIFEKISKKIFFEMIPLFFENDLNTSIQIGKPTYFKRRKPEQSNLIDLKNIDKDSLYDFIRMLDADSYPKAFLELGNIKIEFSNVKKDDKKLIGKFEIIYDK